MMSFVQRVGRLREDLRAPLYLQLQQLVRQAIETGNRLIMMDAGRVRDDIHGAEKSSLTPADLARKFKIENDRMLLES